VSAYYNDNDPKAAAWLRELIKEGLIADGEVDERSVLDVRPSDLAGYAQCHFFAGIGGWSHALRLAGWPEDRPVWTGSCPCQPFSVAGKGRGESDERHLWPEFRRLIGECSPPVVFGEQVASKAGRGWLSRVRADLETLGYGVGAADLCAAGVNAPHIRQRLYWVADSGGRRCEQRDEGERTVQQPDTDGNDGGMDYAAGARHESERGGEPGESERRECLPRLGCQDGWLALSDGRDASAERIQRSGEHGQQPEDGRSSFWSRSILIPCSDGKARRIEPSIEPLVDGLPGRVGLLRGYGNAIVPQVAAVFIEAYFKS
jgi:DNA (cytosine-5)-methyltransferase 1